MTNPMFVETSVGMINLGNVRNITQENDNGAKVMRFWFVGTSGGVEIPEKEWYKIRIIMAENGLLLVT
jgi:hypothetical protein